MKSSWRPCATPTSPLSKCCKETSCERSRKIRRLIYTARGQLDGILKMVEEDRYCVDISNQLMATAAVIRKANREVLAAHMMGCMTEAIQEGKGQEKIDEIMKLLEKWIKKSCLPARLREGNSFYTKANVSVADNARAKLPQADLGV